MLACGRTTQLRNRELRGAGIPLALIAWFGRRPFYPTVKALSPESVAVLGKSKMNKLIWTLKQLVPLTYRSHYEKDGAHHFCVWRMWMGKCFDIDDVILI